MRTIFFTLFLCALAAMAAMAGPGHNSNSSQSGTTPNNSEQGTEVSQTSEIGALFTGFMEDFAGAAQGASSGSGSDAVNGPCVQVDLVLPDTAAVTDWWGVTAANGYFILTNCAAEPATVMLGMTITINITDMMDTILEFSPVPIAMEAGQTIEQTFSFPLPPYEASYTFCVTAACGDAYAEDCEVIEVVGGGGGLPGTPFDRIGVLAQFGECRYFIPQFEDTSLVVLENYGDFQDGDWVHVSGFFVNTCDLPCANEYGCVVENSIEAALPGGFPFAGCGILVQGAQCVLFAYGGSDSLKFELNNYGDFTVGAEVYVAGNLVVGPHNSCPEADGVVYNDVIESCNNNGEPFQSCGYLVQGDGCVIFTAGPPGNVDSLSLVLDNYGNFQVGDYVHVNGWLEPDCAPGCPDATVCLLENTIEACDTPTFPFAECGELVQGVECVLLQTFFNNTPPDSGLILQRYLLDDYGQFQVGDTVFVTGTYDPYCGNICMEGNGCVYVSSIGVCDDTPPPASFEGPGVLYQGVDCVLFAPQFLPGMKFSLENYGVFAPGDSVYVVGTIYSDCPMACTGANACILENTIEFYDGNIPSSHYEGCGVLLQGSECVYFQGPGNVPMILQNYGDFQVFDTVFVSGDIDTCINVCSDAYLCLGGNTIESCGGGPGNGTAFTAAGVLLQYECLMFMPFNASDLLVTLDNYGDFGAFDSVIVSGTLFIGPDSICVEAMGHVVNNGIEAFTPSDSAPTLETWNHPNPFNPATTIVFNLPAPATITLTIHNILGQQVAKLIDGRILQGRQEIIWDGRDDAGRKQASGIYLYNIASDKFGTITKKMVMVK